MDCEPRLLSAADVFSLYLGKRSLRSPLLSQEGNGGVVSIRLFVCSLGTTMLHEGADMCYI
jgi:hypothetical protein